ncbi:MAG: dethiobiotin synthase [Polynucleobacter sp. 24-46-87]|jgi:dethiobiotin synthetase|uniref:dethiobiotin synthase n=1 Tax=unclassified Polynucleobacter TaxID=2640945 RepID=UPI000BCF2714|nr:MULTISPECIES: dethiobiotin synthase [unclassified Polynucleobacter]OYY21163.1 MAG: dethiobiotin synthase [Polynucleobacter sp. 35-46-11]OZA16318.1 MAG: dethiobiotin synthase [Polynucleobacter sp. 24-46-87]OZA78466.1 MAG: dethiobiotin synthase [Polynucleobacter sp. 39-46-10]
MTLNAANGFFVTGTDTEVGKTLISGALILKLREAGVRAIGFKPVVAGTYLDASGKKLNEDLETLRLASGLSPQEQSLCPYILDEAAAPHLVAKKNNIYLDSSIILGDLHSLNQEFEATIVEGAGGFLVPLNDQEDLGDLAQAMDLPVILVVGMRLGCINHALLTCEAIQSRQLTIAGWVANTLSEEMSLLNENIQTLKERIFAPFLGVIPTLPEQLQKSENAPYSLEALRFVAEHIKLPE